MGKGGWAWMQRGDDVIFLSSLIKIDPRPKELLLLPTGSFDPKTIGFGLDLFNLGLDPPCLWWYTPATEKSLYEKATENIEIYKSLPPVPFDNMTLCSGGNCMTKKYHCWLLWPEKFYASLQLRLHQKEFFLRQETLSVVRELVSILLM